MLGDTAEDEQLRSFLRSLVQTHGHGFMAETNMRLGRVGNRAGNPAYCHHPVF